MPSHISVWQTLKGVFGVFRWQEFEGTLTLNPNFASGHYNLGVLLMRQGQHGSVLPEFQEALRLKPDYGEAEYYLGLALSKDGKQESADEAFRLARQIDPLLKPPSQ